MWRINYKLFVRLVYMLGNSKCLVYHQTLLLLKNINVVFIFLATYILAQLQDGLVRVKVRLEGREFDFQALEPRVDDGELHLLQVSLWNILNKVV